MRRLGVAVALAGLLVAFAPASLVPARAAARQPLLVADVGPLSSDERLLFAALQGIVNRHGPRIYLEGMDDTAATW